MAPPLPAASLPSKTIIRARLAKRLPLGKGEEFSLRRLASALVAGFVEAAAEVEAVDGAALVEVRDGQRGRHRPSGRGGSGRLDGTLQGRQQRPAKAEVAIIWVVARQDGQGAAPLLVRRTASSMIGRTALRLPTSAHSSKARLAPPWCPRRP